MTEQIEDEFWAQERTRAAAERGRQADPSACGTCRGRVEAGGQVEHDECAQRATLLQAPDHPHYELITGMTEEEVWALPARFHTPVYLDTCTPKTWVCAVCWGDGWNTQWPCKTAQVHGTAVFTPEHQAETAAKKQAAELAELRQELDRVRSNRDYWRDRYRAESRTTWSTEVPPGGEVCADCGEPVESEPCAEHNPAAVAEQLRAELAKYVGAEPTIAEEMAYLSRCLDAVRDLCTKAEEQAGRWEQPLPVPEWVAPVRAAAEGLVEREKYPLAMPWARLMDDEDLSDFLDELVDAAVTYGHSKALDEVEATCARWRAIAEAQHAHNTAPGPAAEAGGNR